MFKVFLVFLYLVFSAVRVHRKVANSFKLEFVQNFGSLDWDIHQGTADCLHGILNTESRNTLNNHCAHWNISVSPNWRSVTGVRGTHGIDVTQEAIGHFRCILGILVQESIKTGRYFHSVRLFNMIYWLWMTASDFCDSQSFIKAHFTHQWLADPVDEGLWFLCCLRTAAAHLQFHNFTLSILRQESKSARHVVRIWTRWYVKYCFTEKDGSQET